MDGSFAAVKVGDQANHRQAEWLSLAKTLCKT